MSSLNLKEHEHSFPWFHPQGILPFKAVTFFGGSFNPWHEGHSECVRLYQNPAPLIVVPDYNPQKELVQHSSLEAFYQHLLAASGLPASQVYPGMLLKQTKNPTIFWVQEMKERYPDLEINLLMGADSFKNLSTWVEIRKLLSFLSTIFVTPRLETDDVIKKSCDFVQANAPQVTVEILPRHLFEHVSSTEIRKKNSLP